jgi:ankyrin repeat protein
MLTKISTLVVVVVLMTMSTVAQEITKEMYLAFKSDNASALRTHVAVEGHNLCYDVKETSYALISLAIKMEANECFDFLIAQDTVDLNLNCAGKTPLLYAAKYGQLDMLKALIEKGGDLNYRYKGRTALDYARKYRQQEIVDYLVALEK